MKEVLLTSSVLITVLLFLRVIFAKKVRRTWIYAAWLLVALRLLFPVQIGQLSFSVLHVMQSVTNGLSQVANMEVAGVTEYDAYQQVLRDYVEEDTSVFVPAIQEEIASNKASGMTKEEIAERIEKDHPDGDIYAPEAQQQVQQKLDEVVAPVTLGQIATWVWLFGVAIMVIWLATGNLLLGRALRKTEKAVQCDSPLPVYVSDAAISPCLAGLFRPAVYLTPESAADETVMRHVLAHELTHYRHRDHIWAIVRCVCLCVYWFNPLVWVAAWFSRRDCELACDEGALKHLGEDARVDYGKALLQVVSQSSIPGRLMLTATTMAETKKQLKERVNYIVQKQKISVVATICMLLVCVILAGCVTSGPSDPTDPAEKKPWEVSEEVQLQIKQDYIEFRTDFDHACTPEDVSMVVISQVNSGYALVISCKCGSVDLDASWDRLYGEMIADLEFFEPDGWWLRFYQDGKFYNLDGAFNLAVIQYEHVRTIWRDYYAQFPIAYEKWQQVNAGAALPPERDSSGLDYEVNEDGKTCTITGMGVCNDRDVVIPEVIDVYQVTAIGRLAFWSQIRITSITMPDSVVSIGSSAFEDCEQLKNITLSASLETIGIHAFKGCKALETICLPESLTLIDGGAFSGCSALTKVTVPDRITSISSGAFKNCKKLMSLSLPAGITDLGDGAFAGCPNLVIIEFKGTMAQWKAINQMTPWWDPIECCINCLDGQLIENKG